MQIAVLLFDRFTALDAVGPYEVLSRLAGQIAGTPTAQAIQLGIEYDPQPPYHVGSPTTAPFAITQLLRLRRKRILRG